jgi:hypothetical protein
MHKMASVALIVLLGAATVACSGKTMTPTLAMVASTPTNTGSHDSSAPIPTATPTETPKPSATPTGAATPTDTALVVTPQPAYTPASPSTPTPTAIASTNTPAASPTKITAQTTGQDYYIDPVNGNDGNGGTSPQEAWRTLRNVYSYRSDYRPTYAVTLEPGDTIYLLDGVHSAIYRPGDDSGPTNGRPAVMRFRDVHGSAEAPIRLLAYPGHHPVIDPDYQGEGLYIQDSSWREIAGIEFRRSMSQGEGGNIAIQYSNHIKIHDVEVHDADGADDDNLTPT